MTTLNSPKETFAYGKKLATKLRGGDILLLYGELGAGKTSLVKGLAAGLGIYNEITSPTFSILNIYKIKNYKIKNFIHIDTYRLKDEKELLEIGAGDYLGQPDTVCAIEWPEKIADLLKTIPHKHKIIALHLKHSVKNNQRLAKIEYHNRFFSASPTAAQLTCLPAGRFDS